MEVLAVRAQLGSVGRSAGSSPRLSGLRHSARGLPALRRIVCRSSEAEPAVGGGSPPGSTNSGGGGDGGDGNGGNGAAAGGAILAGRAIESLPAEMAEALKAGKLPQEILQRFLDMDSNPFLSWLMKIGGFRERLLADPGFMIKVAIEVGIGICTKTTAEYTKRGDDFKRELDFVLANVIMAIIADFMLVWLPAPTYSTKGAAAAGGFNPLAKLFAGCPDNAFQKVPPGYAPFTAGQRVGAVVRNGMKLFGVGFFASLLGVGMTNALMAVRQMLDPSFVPLNPPQDVLVMSAAYGSYMASSSNLRYQILAGLIEERGIEVMFKSNPAACAVLSFIVRTGNTFLGSLLWVDYIRLLGLQKAGGGH
ncbi:hypothetical protein ABPG77_005331 [Micractinium sp. CCAP 211/92]